MSASIHSIRSEDKEKYEQEEHLEVAPLPHEQDEDAPFGGYAERRRREKRLLWKMDARMSILVVIYILNYIDRNNAAAARSRGLETDLNLVGQEYDTLLSILYVGYILMQIPSNMFLNYTGRPSLYLPFCMMIWGMISALTGITTNFIGALLTRFFLGFVEAAFFPGSLFLLSKWYTRKELALRMSILYCGSIISNAFGSLLATGILDGMNGKLGHAAWRWLFYIEGSLTIFVALLSIFILPDFPENTRWLSPDERALAVKRMEWDAGVGDQKETEIGGFASGFTLAMKDWRVWWLALGLTAQVTSLSFNAFFPTLTGTLGFNPTITLVLVAPPFIVAAIAAFFYARHSDAVGERTKHIVLALSVGMIGYIIPMCTEDIAARYVALFIMGLSYCGYVLMFSLISISIPRPPSKRAVALAFTNCISQLGNVAGSYIWLTKWGPSYRNSYAICISCQVLAMVVFGSFRWELKRMNVRLEQQEKREGHKEKGFRYTL